MSTSSTIDPVTRLPLRDGTRAAQLSRAFQLQGWLYGDSILADDTRPREVIWVTADDATTVHLIEDQFIGKSYAVVRGPDREAVARQVGQIAPVQTLEEIEQGLARPGLADATAASLCNAAALAADRAQSQRYLALFRAGLAWQSAAVRAVMVEALSYVEWPEVPGLVRMAAEMDPDPKVQAHARALLKTYEPKSEKESE